MSTVVYEGDLYLPVLYATWADWRGERRVVDVVEDLPLVTHEFCAMCWGQGRTYGPAANGEGLVPSPCPTCEGTGRTGALA